MFALSEKCVASETNWSTLWPASMTEEGAYVVTRTNQPSFKISHPQTMLTLLQTYTEQNWPTLAEWSLLSAEMKEAVASEWFRSFSFRLLIPTLTLFICDNKTLALTFQQLNIDIDPNHKTTRRFVLDIDVATVCQSAPEGDAALIQLLEYCLWPMIEHMADLTGASARMLWGNAASYWQWWVHTEELKNRCRDLAAQQRLQIAQSFISHVSFPIDYPNPFLGQKNHRNPMYQPMRQKCIQGEDQSIRRVCCQRYHLPETEFCSYCPHRVTSNKFSPK